VKGSPTVAVLLVTHNSEKFLPQTLASIGEQSRPPDALLAIDDLSTDNTRNLLTESGFTVSLSTSTSSDLTTRIAQNFHQGVREAENRGLKFVILGDHDDVWHPQRIAHQVQILETNSGAAIVASDGFLIDEHGAAVPGTLRGTFPVPTDFTEWTPRRQRAYTLRHSVATGGASALNLSRLRDWSIPPGWLHDRWWSLQALSNHALIIDTEPVIDYRISSDQQVGLDTADQEHTMRWAVRRLQTGGRTLRRAWDLRGLDKS